MELIEGIINTTGTYPDLCSGTFIEKCVPSIDCKAAVWPSITAYHPTEDELDTADVISIMIGVSPLTGPTQRLSIGVVPRINVAFLPGIT
jgi:hypothetical protein